MAEPQAETAAEQARAKPNAAPPAEPRSFEGAKPGRPPGPPGDAVPHAAAPVIDGGRQIAEQGRRVGQQVADNWRHAIDPLLAMQYDMSQWFDDLFRHTFGFRAGPSAHGLRPLGAFSPATLFGLPPADMRETAEAHLLEVELPGLGKDDVDLSIVGDTLVVCGHRIEATDDATATYRVNERRYGRFERSFPIPPDVERERIQAQFRDGVLKITLPRDRTAAPAKSRIEIRG